MAGMTGTTAYRIFFGRGSDARVAGQPISSCPFQQTSDARYVGFVAGWTQCDHDWGVDAKWPVRRLPEVKENIGDLVLATLRYMGTWTEGMEVR